MKDNQKVEVEHLKLGKLQIIAWHQCLKFIISISQTPTRSLV
ncbi:MULTISPECIES: hypothetical protein [unclassified Okeania]|nr:MULTISPECIES: hypothetical protein [unclassified Okeania]